MLKIATEYLSEVRKELGLNPRGKLITADMLTGMLDGKFTPMWTVNEALSNDHHKRLSLIGFAGHTPSKIANY